MTSAASGSPDVTKKAKLEGYFGASGTGKSTSIKRRLQAIGAGRSTPLVVFDPKHEYPTGEGNGSEPEFLSTVNRMNDKHAPTRWAVLRPPFDPKARERQFDRFCRVALAIAQAKGGCVIVVDEAHLVTDSSGPPPGWMELVNTGRAWGVHIIAASIRPQGVDMEFRSNLTYIRAGRLGEKADCERIAAKLGGSVAWEEIAALPNLDYFERDLATGTPAERGTIEFE